MLGGLRPYRNSTDDENNTIYNKKQLFEWTNGPLIIAMQNGNYFLADEISLAEDSVLERLNCILEPDRTVLLAEKGGVNENFLNEHVQSSSSKDCSNKLNEFIIKAIDGFQFFATMNPGGDFGKKELSPALRNRFTEIWCPISNDYIDLTRIAKHSFKIGFNIPMDGNDANNIEEILNHLSKIVIKTIYFIKEHVEKFNYSIRDILAWVLYITKNSQINEQPQQQHSESTSYLTIFDSLIFGLETIFLDSLEMLPHETYTEILKQREIITEYLLKEINNYFKMNLNIKDVKLKKGDKISTNLTDSKFGIKPFYINLNQSMNLNEFKEVEKDFMFTAPTTLENLFRLLSALTLNKPILLEGPPGVGKTSLIENISKQIGYKIVRINLCEHTDLTDLFGTDLPAEDIITEKLNTNKEIIDNETVSISSVLGSFVWRDGPLLSALKTPNTWILLDELNLAPQSVLEGLNAILDHRGEIYIPELNKTFKLGLDTRIFASQNPLRQGGGRKGLPQSFLNRFTKVYLRKLQTNDLLHVVQNMYGWYFENLKELFNVLPNESSSSDNDSSTTYLQINKQIYNLSENMVKFSEQLDKGINNLEFGYKGGPYEVNLRDILRWCDFISNTETGFIPVMKRNQVTAAAALNNNENYKQNFMEFQLILYEKMKLVYCQRMRTDIDKHYIYNIFDNIFECSAGVPLELNSKDINLYWTNECIYLGNLKLSKNQYEDNDHSSLKRLSNSIPILLSSQKETMKSLMDCILMSKPVILCGPSDRYYCRITIIYF